MKTWYISVLAHEDSSKMLTEEVFNYILQGSKREVTKQAKECAKRDFLADCGTVCKCTIDDIYETSAEATLRA